MIKTWILKMMTYLSMASFFWMMNPHLRKDASADSDEDEELDRDKLDGLINEAKIEHFNAILFEAQAMAVKAEHEANGEKPKRK